MDLNAYGRVLRRHWYVVAAGAALALVLATLSYYRVDLNGGSPTFTPRKAEVWQSEADLMLTEPGFPAGRRRQPLIVKEIGGETITQSEFSDPSSFSGLASLYARLAESDEVRARIEQSGGPLEGTYQAIAGADTTFGRAVYLPMVAFFGKASTPEGAQENARRALNAFVRYIHSKQGSAKIPEDNRVVLQVLNEPQDPILIEGRKKTLPIAVFLAVMFAAVALAFVLENMRSAPTVAERPQAAPPPPSVGEPELERTPQRREADGERVPRAPAALGTRRRARGLDTLR